MLRGEGAPPGGRGRGRGSRTRKVSQRVAVVDDDDRQNAITAHLDALENDNEEKQALFAADSDDEYVMSEADEGGSGGKGKKRRKKKAAVAVNRRTTRGARERHSAHSFAVLLEEAQLHRLPPTEHTYLTSLAKPAATCAPRKLCSVCGAMSPYCCVRCGSRYCCVRCYVVHTETRCLKFTA